MNAAKEKLIIAASRPDGVTAPDGPSVERFSPQEVAAALESEIAYTRKEYAGCAWQSITMHMDVPDARALAFTLGRSDEPSALRFAQELISKLTMPVAEHLPKLTVVMNIDAAVELAKSLRSMWIVAV